MDYIFFPRTGCNKILLFSILAKILLFSILLCTLQIYLEKYNFDLNVQEKNVTSH